MENYGSNTPQNNLPQTKTFSISLKNLIAESHILKQETQEYVHCEKSFTLNCSWKLFDRNTLNASSVQIYYFMSTDILQSKLGVIKTYMKAVFLSECERHYSLNKRKQT